MRILFVHQNAPGQFRHLAPHLARAGHDVVFLGQRDSRLPGPVRSFVYKAPKSPGDGTHPYLRRADGCVRNGQAVARACFALGEQGFRPDVVIGHPGWGELMFLREALPGAAILSYCEMFHRADGQDTGYIPETAIDLDGRCRIRAWNADLLVGLDIMDRGLSPTAWQRDQHPASFRDRIAVIHDGIDTAEVAPSPEATFKIPDGPCFRIGDEVVTYVARDLEPVRGFNLMMRALPELLRRRPRAHVVICGGDGVSYGRPPPAGTWRETMLRTVSVDPARVHFVSQLPRPAYLDLLRVSALHLYLSVPFVLSWSCTEALAAGCLLLASDVAPVREVVQDGYNGMLIDARETACLAARAADLLESRRELDHLRRAARAGAIERFDLRRCLAEQTQLVEDLVK